MTTIDPAVEANFWEVLEDHTAGDPMRPEVKWTNLSRRQIAKRITERLSQKPRRGDST